MPVTITLPLDLPEGRVLASRVLEEATRLLQVESPRQPAQCHRGGREIDRFDGVDQPIRLRHLPVVGREGFIEIRPKRYRCPFGEGGPTTTQRCPWDEPHRPHPTAFAQEGLKRLVPRTVADVRRQLALGVKAVNGIREPGLAPVGAWGAFTALETVGIDEGARRKGHGQSGAVSWARDAPGRTPVLTVLPDRRQATVQAFLETIPQDVKAPVQRVGIDRGESSAGAVAAALPKARLGGDRFHVAVHYREAGADRRKQECRRLNAGRPADQPLPTAALRRLLRREWSSLTPAQQGQLLELFEQPPPWVSADLLRTLLTAIFAGTPDRATAQTRLRRWGEPVKAAGLPGLETLLNPLPHWQDGRLNAFEGRPPRGFVEGLNNNRKRLKRRGFG